MPEFLRKWLLDLPPECIDDLIAWLDGDPQAVDRMMEVLSAK